MYDKFCCSRYLVEDIISKVFIYIRPPNFTNSLILTFVKAYQFEIKMFFIEEYDFSKRRKLSCYQNYYFSFIGVVV